MSDEKQPSDLYWIEIRENSLKKWRIFKLENLIRKIVNNLLFYSKLFFLFVIIFILLELSKWGIIKYVLEND